MTSHVSSHRALFNFMNAYSQAQTQPKNSMKHSNIDGGMVHTAMRWTATPNGCICFRRILKATSPGDLSAHRSNMCGKRRSMQILLRKNLRSGSSTLTTPTSDSCYCTLRGSFGLLIDIRAKQTPRSQLTWHANPFFDSPWISWQSVFLNDPVLSPAGMVCLI